MVGSLVVHLVVSFIHCFFYSSLFDDDDADDDGGIYWTFLDHHIYLSIHPSIHRAPSEPILFPRKLHFVLFLKSKTINVSYPFIYLPRKSYRLSYYLVIYVVVPKRRMRKIDRYMDGWIDKYDDPGKFNKYHHHHHHHQVKKRKSKRNNEWTTQPNGPPTNQPTTNNKHPSSFLVVD